MNKKLYLFTVLVVCFSLLFSSCFSLLSSMLDEDEMVNHTRIVEWTFNESVPAEQTSKILFWFDIKTYNGIDISEVFKTKERVSIMSLTNIPAGDAEFTFDSHFYRSRGRTTIHYTIRDCQFKYKFEPGKQYFVTRGYELKEKGGMFKDAQYTHYVRIYDYFPEFTNGRINSKQYKKLKTDLEAKDFNSRLIASIPIFDTDNLTE